MAGLPPHPPHLNFTALATTPLRSISRVPTKPPRNDHHMTSMAIFTPVPLQVSTLGRGRRSARAVYSDRTTSTSSPHSWAWKRASSASSKPAHPLQVGWTRS